MTAYTANIFKKGKAEGITEGIAKAIAKMINRGVSKDTILEDFTIEEYEAAEKLLKEKEQGADANDTGNEDTDGT